ncbi:hypothetical protein GCM10007967_32150 [Xylanimonas ulmi]|uniref:Protein kinase domain-containing protein n=1 Tax=Xylanimonas ulmi TaxID=228973 RepID=A0A4Q7M1M0_9MICO|nr:hypothetical protein EV386_0730 [Xylanibacterium ulmi]
MPVPADAAARAALTARVTALTGVRHAHLVAVLGAGTTRPGVLDVVYARGEAADLPTVLAVRGRLTPAEAAAVGVNLAQALAALHAAGLSHGPIEPCDVVLRAGGAPALRPRTVAPPEEWTTAQDVRSLARLVDGLLGSRPVTPGPGSPFDGDRVVDPDGALRAALGPALGADPRARPEAGTLAALVDAACEPKDLRLPDPATLAGAALAGTRRAAPTSGPAPRPVRRPRDARPGRQAASGSRRVVGGPPTHDGNTRPQPDSPRRGGGPGRAGRERRRWAPRWPDRAALRPAAVVVSVGLTVGLMTGAGLTWRDHGARAMAGGPTATPSAPPPDAPSQTPEAAPTSGSLASAPQPLRASTVDPTLDRDRPGDAATVLTQRRLDLIAGAAGDLTAVNVVGSAAERADSELLAQFAAQHVRPEGPRATVRAVDVVAEDGSTAHVRIEYVIEAHAWVAADGTRTTVAASPRRISTLSLRWTSDGWRVEGVA